MENKGAKNLFPNNATSQTVGDVTFTVKSDGSITANGTKTNNDWLILSTGNTIKAGTYVLYDGLPVETTGCQLIVSTDRSLGTAIMATAANARPKTTVLSTDYTGLYYAIRIASGTVVNNLTFYPMLCTKAEWDISHAYVPYGKTNAELTKYDAAQDAEIAWNVNNGVKNLFKNTAVTTTYASVTFTVNSDGTVSLSGTASGVVAVLNIGTVTLKAGTYIVSGCPAGGSWAPNTNKYRIRIAKNGSWLADETGNGYTVSVNGSDKISLQVNSAVGLDATGLVFKPMIRHAAITDSAFVPYALPNPVLTQEVNWNVNQGVKNLLWNHEVGYSETLHGRTFTVLSDGGIKITGTASDSTNADFYIIGSWRNRDVLLNESNEQLKMRLSCAGDYGYNEIRLRVMDRSTGSTVSESGIEVNKDRTFSHVVTTVFISVWTTVTLPSDGIIVYPMIRPAAITDPTFQPYALPNPTLTPAVIKAVDEGAKNLLNLNTGFTKYTNKGITYEDNSDGTIKVSGTSSSADSYITLYDRNTDNLFGIQKGETVVIRSTSDNVSINLVYKRSGGGYGLTVYGYKDSPATFTIPSDFAGFLLRIGVPMNGTTVNEDVGGMICTAADWDVSQKFVPYRPSWQEMAEKTAQIGLKLVKSQTVRSNTEVTYAMNKNDFLESSPILEGSIGTYVISVMPWSTSPNFSLYTVSYTGGSFACTSIVKIAGADRTVTISNGVISISGFPSAGAKVSIHAML